MHEAVSLLEGLLIKGLLPKHDVILKKPLLLNSYIKVWPVFIFKSHYNSDLLLPDYPALSEAFGAHTNASDVSLPMAKLSFLYDTALDMPVDVQLNGKHASERDLAMSHLAQTNENDLLLYDRGYYAYWFFLQYALQQRDFCFRLRGDANTQAKSFLISGKKQAIILLEATQACNKGPKKGVRDCSAKGALDTHRNSQRKLYII